MYQDVSKYVAKCPICHSRKTPAERHGQIPPKTPQTGQPWQEIAVDLMGPFKQHSTLTIVDVNTRWIEIVPIVDRTSETVASAFENEWLNRYPRPSLIIHDQGPEFRGKEFQAVLEAYGLRQQVSSTANPQSNAIVERVHRTIEEMINSQIQHTSNWTDLTQAVAFALRATYHTSLGSSPAQRVFKRDMIHDVAYETNWRLAHQRRIEQIRLANAKENKQRTTHTYNPGDQVYLRFTSHKRPKIGEVAEGPYPIVGIRENGTIVLDKGLYTEIVNIRNIQPLPSNKGENVLKRPLPVAKSSMKAYKAPPHQHEPTYYRPTSS